MEELHGSVHHNGHGPKATINKGIEKARDIVASAEGGVDKNQVSEGEVTKHIEGVTAQVPSGTFLTFALGAMGMSALLQCFGRKQDAQFVGQWVPTILILGLYKKLVKLHGSE